MAKKTKKLKKSKALTKQSKNFVWAGAQALMSKPMTEKQEQERGLVLFVAKALKINPFGINILGNLPYTNNVGRKEKMAQYDKKARFEYDWRKISESDDDKAVCRARVVVGNKSLTDWVVGECSPATTKMSTLRGYQNHIAQTRAENRAFEAAFGNRMREEMFKNIQKVLAHGETTLEIAEKALVAGGPSAEEMGNEKSKRDAPVLPGKSEKSDPVKIAANFINNANSLSSLIAAEKRIKENSEFTENNKKYLLNLVTSRKKKISRQ